MGYAGKDVFKRCCEDLSMPDIYAYSDYRKFIADIHAEKKEVNSRFSLRTFARVIGCDTAHLTRILKGTTNISLDFAAAFSEAVKLTKKQSEFFAALVRYNQAKTHEDKKKFFERLISFKDSSIKVVSADQYEFYDKWYYSAVRTVLGMYRCKDNYRELGECIIPAISPIEAKKALDLLLRLSFITLDDNGYYIPIEPLIKNDLLVSTIEINNFMIASLDRAKQALDFGTREDRVLSTTTLAVSKATFDKIKDELRDFRMRILSLAKEDADPTRAYDFNFQVFPISRTIDALPQGSLSRATEEALA